jgi:predicted GIY-YIG superfamily endonuclease
MDTVPPHAQEGNPYTIYALIDPRDLAVCYIGITNDVYDRFMQHLRCDGTNSAKDTWIAELKQENVMLIMKTLEVVETVEQARERETFWIHHHRFLGIPLFNQSIPSIRLPKRVTQPVLIRVYSARPNAGRKGDYAKGKEIVLYRYKHHAWPNGLSRHMEQWYEWFYFTKPEPDEKPFRGKGYKMHQRSYKRGQEWIAEYEAAQEGA